MDVLDVSARRVGDGPGDALGVRDALSCFHVCSLSEDAEDSKGTKQNSLRFQSLFLLARLDRVLTREDVDSSQGEEDDEEDDELHACIIPHSPAYASPCTSFLVDLS